MIPASLGGARLEDQLDPKARASLDDLRARRRYLEELLGARRLDKRVKVDELIQATAGLTQLLPRVVQDAEVLGQSRPRFGQAPKQAGPLSAESLQRALEALEDRPKAEREVLFEELVAAAMERRE